MRASLPISNSSKSHSSSQKKTNKLLKKEEISKSSNSPQKIRSRIPNFQTIQNENQKSANLQFGTRLSDFFIGQRIHRRTTEMSPTGFRPKTFHLVQNREKDIKNLKMFRPITSRNERRKIINSHSVIERISKCNSKIELFRIFSGLSVKWKQLIKHYLERCFLIHLHLRQIKDFSELMQQRQNIYDAVDDPLILEDRVRLANNLVKNFCKGFTNFVVIFYKQLKRDDWLSPCESKSTPAPKPPNLGRRGS